MNAFLETELASWPWRDITVWSASIASFLVIMAYAFDLLPRKRRPHESSG